MISPQGANTTPATFKQEGDKVSGIFKSPQGTLPFDGGKLTGNDLKFTFTINSQGMALPITLTGKVEGDTMAGKADFGGFAEGEWTAKRAAATTTTSTATTTSHDARPPRRPRRDRHRFGGKWDVMLKTPAGDMPANATLSDTNGKVDRHLRQPARRGPGHRHASKARRSS